LSRAQCDDVLLFSSHQPADGTNSRTVFEDRSPSFIPLSISAIQSSTMVEKRVIGVSSLLRTCSVISSRASSSLFSVDVLDVDRSFTGAHRTRGSVRTLLKSDQRPEQAMSSLLSPTWPADLSGLHPHRGGRAPPVPLTCYSSGIKPSCMSTVTPSSRPTSSVMRPFSTLRMVVPVNRIVLPVLAGSDPTGMSLNAVPV
jgi:hypothetical protein